LGGNNNIKKEIKRKNNYIILFVFLSVIVLGLIYSNLNLNLQHNFIYYIFMGILEAITMILPGISGTAVLMMFGCYNTVITAFSNFTNFYISTRNFLILLPFAIGIAIGAIFTLKFVNILFKKYKNITYNVIYGFSLSTILFILVNCLKSSYSLIDLLIGLALFWLGYIAIKKINSLN